MNKYKAYTDAANDPHFMQESESVNPSPTSKYPIDPMWEVTSKYYIDRLWEEYHKMKEELADTKSKLAQSEDYIDEVLQPELQYVKNSFIKLRDELIIAEGQRDQAKMRAEALLVVNNDLARDNETLETECDALLKVYEAAKVWAEVTDPPRTDNYREFREATINLLDVVALVFAQRGPNFTYATRPSHIPVETWEDTRARCS